MKRIYSALLSALVFACGGAVDDEAFDTTEGDELGAAGFAWKVRPSATGGRTWGADTNAKSCTKTSNVTCRWVSSFNADAFPAFDPGEQIIKICVSPVFWGGNDFAEAVADVDLFVTNMRAEMQGSSVPYSWSRVQPLGGGSDCATADATIIVKPGITTAPFGNDFTPQYVVPTFSSCPTLLESAGNVTGVYQRCRRAQLLVAYTSITARGGAKGLSASRIRTQKREAMAHGLLGLIGIGSQTSNSSFVSTPSFSDTSSRSFISNEEKCRLKTLTETSADLFTSLVNQITIDPTNTCAN